MTASRDEAELVAGLLDDALGLEVHLQHDPRAFVVEAVERDDAGVRRAVGRPPGDALVGVLLGDLGVPLAATAADLGHPVQLGVVDLPDLLDALHELRELLELRPLVVRGAYRDIDVDRLLDPGHGHLLFVGEILSSPRSGHRKLRGPFDRGS